MDRIASLQRAFHHATLQNHSSILIEMGVEDQGFQRRVRIALGTWQLFDDAGQHVFNPIASLCRNRDRLKRIEPQFRINLLRARSTSAAGRSILLITGSSSDHVPGPGRGWQPSAPRPPEKHRQPSTRLHTPSGSAVLRAKNQRGQAYRSDSADSLDRPGTVGERNRIALDRNAPFTLDIHRVEHLVVELTLRHAATGLDQSIGQSRLTMINMGDNAKVTNMLHSNRFL